MLNFEGSCRFGLRALVLGFVLCAITPASASAQDVEFAFLIQDGWAAVQNRSFADERGMVYHGTGGKPVFQVVNGQKTGAPIGTANIVYWYRAVPDPYFAPISPLAGLIVLEFYGSVVWHLAIIDTPTGPKTTFASWVAWWFVDTDVSGAWRYSDGTTVVGGTGNDLVVAGVVRYAAESFIADPSVKLLRRVPTSPFEYDPTPLETHSVGNEVVKLGSFYGEADNPFARTPVRSFTAADFGLSPFAPQWTQVVVFHVAGDTYVVVACSVDPTPPAPQYCTVSGTGGFATLTGWAWYQPVGNTFELALQVYAAR